MITHHKVLIVGRLPPPIGGVTMHVKRLVKCLRQRGFEFDFCEPRKESPIVIIRKILCHRVIHIHFSRPGWQLLVAILCRLFPRKLIITYHGQWGRYRWPGNLAVSLSAMLAAVPVVQNQLSLKMALRWNKRAKCISTFIPDRDQKPLPEILINAILEKQRRYKTTFCTNAWNLAFDKNARETYGISELVQWFAKRPESLLLLSDPSGKYGRHIERTLGEIPENVLIIDYHHDFRSVLKCSDAFIRNTSTDGVSLSIQEAHELGVPVLASDTVDRPAFCSLFSVFADIDMEAKLAEARRLTVLPATGEDAVAALMKIYDGISEKRT